MSHSNAHPLARSLRQERTLCLLLRVIYQSKLCRYTWRLHASVHLSDSGPSCGGRSCRSWTGPWGGGCAPEQKCVPGDLCLPLRKALQPEILRPGFWSLFCCQLPRCPSEPLLWFGWREHGPAVPAFPPELTFHASALLGGCGGRGPGQNAHSEAVRPLGPSVWLGPRALLSVHSSPSGAPPAKHALDLLADTRCVMPTCWETAFPPDSAWRINALVGRICLMPAFLGCLHFQEEDC